MKKILAILMLSAIAAAAADRSSIMTANGVVAAPHANGFRLPGTLQAGRVLFDDTTFMTSAPPALESIQAMIASNELTIRNSVNTFNTGSVTTIEFSGGGVSLTALDEHTVRAYIPGGGVGSGGGITNVASTSDYLVVTSDGTNVTLGLANELATNNAWAADVEGASNRADAAHAIASAAIESNAATGLFVSRWGGDFDIGSYTNPVAASGITSQGWSFVGGRQFTDTAKAGGFEARGGHGGDFGYGGNVTLKAGGATGLGLAGNVIIQAGSNDTDAIRNGYIQLASGNGATTLLIADGSIIFDGAPLTGDGGGLTNLPITVEGAVLTQSATSTHIKVSAASIAALTNGASGVTLSGTFSGDGGGLTNAAGHCMLSINPVTTATTASTFYTLAFASNQSATVANGRAATWTYTNNSVTIPAGNYEISGAVAFSKSGTVNPDVYLGINGVNMLRLFYGQPTRDATGGGTVTLTPVLISRTNTTQVSIRVTDYAVASTLWGGYGTYLVIKELPR